MKKSLYVKEIIKWSRKQLVRLKKPTERKRDLVDRYAFAVLVKCKKR